MFLFFSFFFTKGYYILKLKKVSWKVPLHVKWYFLLGMSMFDELSVWTTTGLKRRLNLTHLLNNFWTYDPATRRSFFTQKKKSMSDEYLPFQL